MRGKNVLGKILTVLGMAAVGPKRHTDGFSTASPTLDTPPFPIVSCTVFTIPIDEDL